MTENSDDKTLNLYPIDYPFETLVARMNAKPPKLILDPDFQRKYKWDKDGWERASRFIESCLMRIPLPSCYFAEDDSSKHLVIDGVQRLTTINRFFNDEFALEGLTTFKDLEGKKFSELGELQSELEATTIRCIILRKENPKNLVREIFSRLNQGAVKLSDQEIRHAMYPGSLDDLLSELSTHPIVSRFGLAEKSEAEKSGREAEEQILRFFAFSEDEKLERFGKSLKDFLDSYMERNANLPPEEVEKLRAEFNTAISNCEKVFGDQVFTNPAADRKRRGLVHYDLLMPTVGALTEDTIKAKENEIREAYKTLCESEDFRKTLSGGLHNKGAMVRRRERWNELLGAVINGS